MTARLISDTWSRVSRLLCIPDEGRLHTKMTVLSSYLAQRYMLQEGHASRAAAENVDERDDGDEAAARSFHRKDEVLMAWRGSVLKLLALFLHIGATETPFLGFDGTAHAAVHA